MSHASRTGTITVQDDRATIVFERRLPYPIESVWAAITDPAQRAAWFGKTTLEQRTGGAFEMLSEGAPVPDKMRQVTGKVLVWDPPHVFEHEWNQLIIGNTVARYELQKDGQGTLLRFSHSGMSVKDAQGFIPGEHAYLDRMEAHIAGTTLPAWTARYGEVAASYAG